MKKLFEQPKKILEFLGKVMILKFQKFFLKILENQKKAYYRLLEYIEEKEREVLWFEPLAEAI